MAAPNPGTQDRQVHTEVAANLSHTTESPPDFPWPNIGSDSHLSTPLPLDSNEQAELENITEPMNALIEPNCKYNYTTDWSSCDPTTRLRTRNGTLNIASSSAQCNLTIMDTKPCFTRSGRGKNSRSGLGNSLFLTLKILGKSICGTCGVKFQVV